jgi:hypothetical protein
MSVLAGGRDARVESNKVVIQRQSLLRSWLFSYEIYIILGVAILLRLYGINTTEFDVDQADIFRMAHDAVVHGHLVATSNIASIGVYNPPGIIYVLMIPAAFSANPIGGAIETALLAVFGVFLTYWFTRHYYGRVAASIASSLFAVTSAPLFYSRFMWNQNLLLFFVPLFMIVLFRGVVDRRPGWLFPALFLYGLLFQWHGSALLLAVPLAVSFLLAPQTVRWRDVVLGMLSLLVLYAPYMLWLTSTRFAVLSLLSQTGAIPSFIDNQAWLLYLHFMSPYDLPFTNKLALLYAWQNFFNWLPPVMAALISASALFALLRALFWRAKKTQSEASRMPVSRWLRVWYWVQDLRSSPYRCGLLVLLVWQAFPVLFLIKHSLLYPHYFIFLMPGPFILFGWFMAKGAEWFHTHGGGYRFVSNAIYVFVSLLLLFQGIAGLASVLDASQGNFDDHQMSYPYYNDLASVQNAVTRAHQLAQQYHAGKLVMLATTYLAANERLVNGKLCTQIQSHLICQNTNGYKHSLSSIFRYFSDQLPIASTVVDDTCLLLPGPSTGPVVVLVPPYEPVIDAFFATNYIHVVKAETSQRLSGPPFRLYVLDPLSQKWAQTTLSSNIQLIDAQTRQIQNKTFVAVRWNVLQSTPANAHAAYTYQFTYTRPKEAAQLLPQTCTLTNLHAGEQLVTLLPQGNVQDSLSVGVGHASTIPYTIMFNSIPFLPAFDTSQQSMTPFEVLKASDGQQTIPIHLNAS